MLLAPLTVQRDESETSSHPKCFTKLGTAERRTA